MFAFELRSLRPLVKHIFKHWNGRHCVGPSRVERKLRQNLGRLGLSQAVIHRLVEMERHLCYLGGGDERADRHQATISWREAGTQPQVFKQQISGVVHEAF